MKSRKANAAEVELRLGAAHNYQVSLASIGNVYLLRRDYFTAISYYQRALARDNEDRVAVKKWARNINLDYARIRLEVDQQTSRVA